MHVLRTLLVGLIGGLAMASPVAKRATLTQISNYGNNPAGIKMYIYVPDKLASSPAVVFSLHGASGNAQQSFLSTPYASLADQYGFVVVYPESPQGAWNTGSATHGGSGPSQSIASMAAYAINTYRANAAKVYATGISSGGTMVFTLAGTYPDVFKSIIVYSAGSPSNIRAMYAGYTGTYPAVQLYLGSTDSIIGSSAFNSTLNTWAPLLGYDTTADQVLSNTPVQGWTKYVLGAKEEGIWAQGVGHPVPVQGNEDMKWWGLIR